MSLSNKLRELLFERNITPTELAKNAGLPIPTVHRMVTGKTQHPNEKALEAVSQFFGISVVELVHAENNAEIKIPVNSDFKKIPVLSWEQLTPTIENRVSESDIVVKYVSGKAFALIMQDYSMKPFVEKGSLLIFDPELQPDDRSYCLVKLADPDVYVLRQVLIDLDKIFIKSLNKELERKTIRLLSGEDKVIARLVEIRVKID